MSLILLFLRLSIGSNAYCFLYNYKNRLRKCIFLPLKTQILAILGDVNGFNIYYIKYQYFINNILYFLLKNAKK